MLDFFRWVPYVGSFLGFVAFIWGLAVYVKATAVSHQFRPALGLLALVLPVIVVAFLSILLIFIVGVVALVTGLVGQGSSRVILSGAFRMTASKGEDHPLVILRGLPAHRTLPSRRNST